MRLDEAYSILEIPSSSTPDEAKKKYRQLSKKYHPDINKEPGAEDKFKKINEAYQIVSTGKDTEASRPVPQHNYPSNIDIRTTISFKESVLGCKQSLKFQ